MAAAGRPFFVLTGVLHRLAVLLHLVAAVLAAIHLVITVMAILMAFATLSFVLGVSGMLVGCGSALRNSGRGDNERKSAKNRSHLKSPNV